VSGPKDVVEMYVDLPTQNNYTYANIQNFAGYAFYRRRRMATTQASIDIKRTPESIFAYMTDSKNRPRWDTSMIEMEQTSAGPKGVGTTYRGAYRMVGARRTWTAKLNRFDPNKAVSYTITSGSLQVQQEVTLVPVEAGTKLNFGIELRLHGLLKLFTPMIIRTVNRQTRANLGRLKNILEK
jgi:uncharacterized protein YndB with AHSA1/START domain